MFQTNVNEWLEEIGLHLYRDNFQRNHIRRPNEMEILKSFGRREIERELGVVKDGRNRRVTAGSLRGKVDRVWS